MRKIVLTMKVDDGDPIEVSEFMFTSSFKGHAALEAGMADGSLLSKLHSACEGVIMVEEEQCRQA